MLQRYKKFPYHTTFISIFSVTYIHCAVYVSSVTLSFFVGAEHDKSCPYGGVHCVGEVAEATLDVAAGRSDVQTHETLTTGTEHLTVVEGQMGLVDEEVQEGVMGEMEIPAVEPYEEAGLWAQRTDAGDILTAVVLHEADVILEIGDKFPSPRLSMAVGGDGGDGCEEIRLVEFVGRDPAIEFPADLRVRHDGIGADDTGDIEGLRRCLERDADVTGLVADGGKGDVLVTEEGQVTVDLITDDKEVVVIAEGSEVLQCLLIPTDSRGIMGVAEDEKAAFVVADLLEVVEIDVVISVITASQRIPHNLPMVSPGREEEGMVDRRHDDDLLVGLDEDVDDHSDTLDDTGDEFQPWPFHLPAMMGEDPVLY